MSSAVARTSRSTAVPAYLALSCVGFIASAPAAHAANDDAGLSAVSQDRRTDILVHGERELDGPKATASIENTPRSITVLPDTVIQESGSSTLEQALRTVPGITFGAAEGGNPIGDRPFIRGYDSQGSIYVDGVRSIGSQSREVFDVEQVQIVRGSDSALGGRGNAGGSINIISKLPRRDTFVAGAVSYGTNNYKRITVDANARLSDNIAFRITAMGHDQDVAGRDAVWQRRWGVAPSFTLGIDSPTKLTVAYYHLTTDELPDGGIPYLYTNKNIPGADVTTYPADHVTTENGRTGTVPRTAFYGLKDRDFRRTLINEATMRASHDFGTVTLRNTVRYNHTNQRYIWSQPDDSQGNVYATGQVFRRALNRFDTTESLIDQLDLYGTAHTGPLKHSFAAGAEFAWEKGDNGRYNVTNDPRCTPEGVARYNCTDLFNPTPDDPWVNYASDTSDDVVPITRQGPDTTTISEIHTSSIYGFDSITVIPQLIVNLGARYDWYWTGVRAPVNDEGFRPETDYSESFFNWQAGVVFKPTKNTSLYASYATSSTPPGSLLGEGREGNAVGASRRENLASLDDLKVETSRNYEVGAKADLFHGGLGLSLALFRTETKNSRTTGPDGFVQYIGAQRVQGIEFGINGKITPDWSVFGGYTYLDAIVTDGGFAATTVGDVTLYAPSAGTGKRSPNTPEHSATLWTTWQVTPAFSIGGGAIYMSRVYGGYADERTIEDGAVVITNRLARAVPGYARFDLTADWKIDKHLDLRVNVQNLTDKRYYNKAYASHYASIAPGRSAFATLNFRY
ncbi:TonB-dependent siderophore receptor [Stakelama sediminis]|uniref:Catecholate siderophore receptor n=1 Tax=Stakelama sediminis TaxID=463200 RepID=A0A840Z000_9SPHN|nr:TonB-dependent siderophore receptor [Stakelama sediminis]MBB5719074.1 catecholate siderophore receptor [Stakelama sediminis]